MSSARYHLLSLVVAGLALALGVGLGAGPVTGRSAESAAGQNDRLDDRNASLQETVAALRARAALDAEVLHAMGTPLTADRLQGQTVLVVATPGARKAHVRQARAVLDAAGATVTGVLSLTPTYADPARAQSPLEDLALRLVPPGVEFADGASAIERVGTVLARSTVRRPADGETSAAGGVDQDAAEVIAGMEELDALRLDGEPGVRAELAVVVSGPAENPTAEAALAGLLTALDAGSRGAVLAGAGSGEDGPLRWVRDAGDRPLRGVSTVDATGSQAAAVGLVLAVDEQARGASGDYGTGRGARRVLPVTAPGG